MSAWLHWICLWLADYYFSATILLAAMLALGTVLREPVKRMLLAWGTLVGLPVLALLCAAPFWPRLSIATSAAETVSAAAPREPTPATPIPTIALPPMHVRLPASNIGPLPHPVEHVEFRPPQVAPVAGAVEPLDFSLLAAAIFLIGSAAMMLWLMVGAIYSRRLCRAATPAPKFVEQELQAITQDISLSPGERVGVRGLPRLLISRLIHTAAAYGLLRPAILLPEDVLTSEHFLAVQRGVNPAATRTSLSASASLRTLLAHELAHIQRRDLWLLASSRLLLVVLFAHPFYWLLRGRVRADQELIADALAAKVCGRHQYAENLVHWARRQPTALPRLAGALGIWERPSQLSRRITTLLDERIRLQTFCSRRWRMSATMGITISIVVLSLITLRPVPTVAETPPPQVTKYLAEMHDAAKEGYKWAVMHYQNQIRGRSLEEIYAWSRHWLDTDLQRATTKDDRLAAYRAHQSRMTRENEIAKVLYKHGAPGGEADVEAASRYFLAEANLWLLRQTEDPPAGPNKPSAAAMTEIKSMRAAAQDAFHAVTAGYEAGVAKLDDVYLWSKRWLQTGIDGATPVEAKKLYGEHRQRMQQLHGEVAAKHGVGAVGGEEDHFNATSFYLAEADFLVAHQNNEASKQAEAVMAAARDAFQAFAAKYKSGSGDLQQTCVWSHRWLHASLATSGPHQTAYLDHRNDIEKLYDDVAAKQKAAERGGGPDDFAVVQFYLAEANLLLAEHADDKTPVDPAPPAKAEKADKGTSEKIQQPAKSSQDSSSLRGVDIVVQRAGGTNDLTNGLPEELGRQIEKLKGVDHVIGGLLDMISFSDDGITRARLYGWPADCPLFDRFKIQEGRTLAKDDKQKIIVGRELAKQLKKKMGDDFELYGGANFEIVGIYESSVVFENNGAIVPLAELQRLMKRPGEVTGFSVITKRPIDEEGLKDLAKRIELYAASLHRDDGSPLQVKAAPVLQFAQGNKDENSHVTEPAGKEEPAAKQPPLNKAEESPTRDQGKHTPESITISGVCVNENKKPIAGARVRLFVEDFHYDDISQRELQEVRSDSEGKFAIKDVNVQAVRERHQALVVTAQSPGKTTAGSGLMEADNASKKAIELKLTPAATLQGRIVDEDGKPVAGAIVSTDCSLVEPVAGICAAITDANGHYEIPDLFPFDLAEQKPQPMGKGGFAVTTRCYANVRHPDYARQVISYTKTPDTVDATIHRTAIVEGRIVLAESNEPAAGVQIEFSNDDIGSDYWTRTKTDGDGKYRLATLPPDNYRLSTTLQDRPNVFKSNVPLKSGINTLDLALERGAVIKGRVIDVSTGRPVAFGKDEQMQINQHDSHGTSYAGMNHAEVQPDGTFTLHIPAGRPYLAMYLDLNWTTVGDDPMFADRFEVAEGESHEVELRVKRVSANGNEGPKPPSWGQSVPSTSVQAPSEPSTTSQLKPAVTDQKSNSSAEPPKALPATPDDAKLMQRVIDGIKANYAQLKTVQGTLEMLVIDPSVDQRTTSPPPKNPPKDGYLTITQAPVTVIRNVFTIQGDNLRSEQSERQKDGWKHNETNVRRGDKWTRLTFYNDFKKAMVGRADQLGASAGTKDPRNLGALDDYLNVLDQLRRSKIVEITQREPLLQIRIEIVDAPKYGYHKGQQFTYVFDPARSFLPVSIISHHDDGSFAHVMDFTYDAVLPGKAWFLRQLTDKAFLGKGIRDVGSDRWFQLVLYRITGDLKVNQPVKDDVFLVQPPAGVEVQDVSGR